MNNSFKATIVRVQKGTFTDEQNQRVVEYAKVYLLTQREQTEYDVGFDYTSASIDVNAFDILKKFIGSEVSLETEMKKASGNTYKMKITKVEDIELS